MSHDGNYHIPQEYYFDIAQPVSWLIIHNTQASDIEACFGTNRHCSIESQRRAASNERQILKLVILSEIIDDQG